MFSPKLKKLEKTLKKFQEQAKLVKKGGVKLRDSSDLRVLNFKESVVNIQASDSKQTLGEFT